MKPVISLGRIGILIAALVLGLWAVSSCASRDDGNLHFSGPTEERVDAGKSLPGTNVRYVRDTPDGAEFVIADQRAVKMVGDSVGWQGKLSPDLDADLGLRVVFYTADYVQLAGTANLTVHNPQPVPGSFPEQPAISFRVPVTYGVDKGDRVPGTTLTYEGKDNQGARIGGLPPGDFPYRQVADSLVWTGRLANGVLLRLDLRVLLFTDNSIQLAGFATLAVG